MPLSASKTEMATIVKVMQLPDSGLEIRDRMWLKITISNAVIGECWNNFGSEIETFLLSCRQGQGVGIYCNVGPGTRRVHNLMVF